MRALWAVYKREVALIFRSIIGYAIAAMILFVIGAIFANTVGYANMVNSQPEYYGGQVIAGEEAVMQSIYVFSFLMFLIAPLLAMRLISEEAREGTLEVLMTLPMSDFTFVFGKFLAVWTFYTFILALTSVYLLVILSFGATINGGTIFTIYLGTWLYGGAALAVSMIWSAIAEDQIVAAFLGAGSVLVLFLADLIAGSIASNDTFAFVSEFIRELSVNAHYGTTMLNGILRGEDIAYFILLIIACLFITTLLVSTRRWRAS